MSLMTKIQNAITIIATDIRNLLITTNNINSTVNNKLDNVTDSVSFLGRNEATEGPVQKINVTTAKSMLGFTTVGNNLVTIANPSAIRFIRVDANNNVSLLTGSAFRTAIAAGTVTSIGITAPSTGISVTGGPITTNGTITIGLANDLAAVENLAEIGVVKRTADDTWSAGKVTNSELVDVSSSTIKGRLTAGVGPVEDLTIPDVKTLLELNKIGTRTFTFGGTGVPAIGTTNIPVCVSNFKGRLTKWRLTSQTAPLGGNFTVRLVSSNNPNFSSPQEVVVASISSIITSFTSNGQVDVLIDENTFLRLEIIAVNSASNWKFEILQREEP